MRARHLRWWLLPAGLLVSCSSVLGADAIAGLKAMMTCTGAPEPTEVLVALKQARALGEASGPGYDDEYCWPLEPAIHWQGMAFTDICAVSGDPARIAAHGDLYWQGPTHPPFTEVWLLTRASAQDLRRWAERTLPASSRFEIDPDGDGTGRNALSCSDWHFPLPEQ